MAALEREFLSQVPVEGDQFALYQRALHVFTEAKRVYDFEGVCASDGPEALARLGALMNASQDSCRDRFACSCPELDDLTSTARTMGALGSRLTGAGWGGCTVSLVREGTQDSFIADLLATYYPSHGGLKAHAAADVVFATLPGSGACIVESAAIP